MPSHELAGARNGICSGKLRTKPSGDRNGSQQAGERPAWVWPGHTWQPGEGQDRASGTRPARKRICPHPHVVHVLPCFHLAPSPGPYDWTSLAPSPTPTWSSFSIGHPWETLSPSHLCLLVCLLPAEGGHGGCSWLPLPAPVCREPNSEVDSQPAHEWDSGGLRAGKEVGALGLTPRSQGRE